MMLPGEVLKDHELNQLLEIAGKYSEEEAPSSKERVASLICFSDHPVFKPFQLELNDLQIIAIILNGILEGKEGLKSQEILKSFHKTGEGYFEAIQRLIKLEQKGVIEGDHENREESLPLLHYFQRTWRISEKLMNQIFPLHEEKKEEIEPYASNEEYLEAKFKRIRFLKTGIFLEPVTTWKEKSPLQNKKPTDVERIDREISKRLTKTTTLFPFESLKKKHSLTYEEEAVLLYLLETHVREETPVSIKELIEFLQNFAENKLKLRLLFKKESKLIKKGLIGTKEDSFSYEGSRKKRVILNEDIMAEILGEKKKRKNRKKELFLKNDLFDVIKPNISFDGVVLHPKTEGQIKDILEMSYGEVSNLLTTWGFKLNRSCETSLAKKKRPSLTMIFYGPPGTGKTLTAQAISTRLNCELLTFDCSKIIDMWVGESQKNVKKIFTQYQDISSKIKTPPVLLLNEADQFLHQRLAADRSTDQMYNQMQNIFLEQLEQFEGVLIATTNLINNIDSAFSRRFDYKVEFKRPGIEERIRLWKALVPKEAPLSPDVDFATLSKKYDFSGGQLSVVIRNAAIKAARRGSSLSQRDFISTCEEEMSGNFDEKAKTKAPVQ